MTTDANDFFIYSNAVYNVSPEEYEKIELLVSAVKAFARSTYQSLYVIDYFKKDFLYVSESLAYMCGQTTTQMKEFGYRLYTEFVPKEEQEMLLEINKRGFDFFENIPVNERVEWSITYDFHILNGKNKRLIHHTLTPIFLDKNGRMWLGLCTISLSSKSSPGHIIMKKAGLNSYYEYSLSGHVWNYNPGISLTKEEKDVLILSAQGNTMNEISEKIHKSVDTIKSYKRKLFEKLEVDNITEAVFQATNYKLL